MATVNNVAGNCNYNEGPFGQHFTVTTTLVSYGTTAALINTPSYNAVAGTLTSTSNGALVVDGVTVAASSIILVKNQATAAQNGIYTVTAAGSGAATYTLTRSAQFVMPVRKGAYIVLTGGNTLIDTGWYLSAGVYTFGVDSVTFSQSANIAPLVGFVTDEPLPGSITYSSAGSGTLSSSGGVALVVDTAAVSLNSYVLVKNQVTAADNGLYKLTVVGPPWTLTRVNVSAAGGPNLAHGQTAAAGLMFAARNNTVTNGVNSGTYWYLYSSVAAIGTNTWDIREAGCFQPINTMNLFKSAVVTIDSDVLSDCSGGALGAVTCHQASTGGVVIDGRNVWWIPFVSGTGTIPYKGVYGTTDVTIGGVTGLGEYLGIFPLINSGIPGSQTWRQTEPIDNGTAMPARGYLKLRSIATTPANGATLNLTNGATVVVNSATGGTRSFIQVAGVESGTMTLRSGNSFTTRGDWFYLDSCSGSYGQKIQAPIADCIPAIQVETGAGTGVYEWWATAGMFGTANATAVSLKWGGSGQIATDSRGKFFGCSPFGLIEFAKRNSCQPSFPDCKYATAAAAVLPNTPTYASATQRLTAGANAALSVDGVSPAVNDRILVKSQATATQNGIYVVTDAGSAGTPWIMTRAADFDINLRVIEGGRSVYITAGNTNIGLYFTLTQTTSVDTTTTHTFEQSYPSYEIPPCTLGTTAALSGATYDNTYETLTGSGTGALTVDGTAVAVNDRILVKDQASTFQNGIYKILDPGTTTTAYSMRREYEFSSQTVPIMQNAYTYVLSGATLQYDVFTLTAPVNVIGTSAATWTASGVWYDFTDCRLGTTCPLICAPTFASGGVTGTLTANTPYFPLKVDGVIPSVNDRILVKDQTTRTQNGIYTVTTVGTSAVAYVLTRAADMAGGTKYYANKRTRVTAGTLNTDTSWAIEANATINTTSISFCTGNVNTEWTHCTVGTTAALPNTPTYANAAGTLTSSVNSTLTVDGVVVALNQVVLVKDQATAAQNGIYTCTAAGSGAAAWVLTRIAGMNNAGVTGANNYDNGIPAYVGGRIGYATGATNSNTYWYLQDPITTANDNKTFIRGAPSMQFKSCRHATIANATFATDNLSSLTSAILDNCVLAQVEQGDRILVKNQTSTLQNGIYYCTTAGSAATRARGFDARLGTTGLVSAGSWTRVTPGIRNSNSTTYLVNCDTDWSIASAVAVLNTTNFAWANCAPWCGYLPTKNARVRIPNVLLTSVVATAPTTPGTTTFPPASQYVPIYRYVASNYTLATRYEFLSTQAALDMEYCLCNWYNNHTMLRQCTLTNCVISDYFTNGTSSRTASIGITGLAVCAITSGMGANPSMVGPTGTGVRLDLRQTNTLTMRDVIVVAGSGTGNCANIAGVGTMGATGVKFISHTGSGTITQTNSSATPAVVILQNIFNSTLQNITVMGPVVNLIGVLNSRWSNLYFALRVVGFCNATQAAYLLNSIVSQSLVIDGIYAVDNLPNVCHYNGLFYGRTPGIATSTTFDVVLKNMGTFDVPLETGITSSNSVPSIGAIIECTLPYNASNFVIKNGYFTKIRTGTFNSLTSCLWDNIYEFGGSNFAPSLAYTANSNSFRGCMATSLAVTTNTNNSTFHDIFTSMTAGRIYLTPTYNELRPTMVYTTAAGTTGTATITTLSGSASVAGSNPVGIYLPKVGDTAIFEMPYFCLGHTALANAGPTYVPAGITGSVSFQYQIDLNNGSGFNGSWLAPTGANLSSHTIDYTVGFRLKFLLTCTVTSLLSSSNLFTSLNITTVTTRDAVQTKYDERPSIYSKYGRLTAVPSPFSMPTDRVIVDTITANNPGGTSDTSATYENQDAVSMTSGTMDRVRVKYSSNSALILPRYGDAFS